jgi:hypothetical protein
VDKGSNHPPNVLNNIPQGINQRLSAISSNETIFNNAAPAYQEAINKSGYSFKLRYEPVQPSTQPEDTKNHRKRHITWFNPPYSCNVNTKIGKKFFQLLNKCFPNSHPLYKIINRNTIKLSYSCMPNVKQRISAHNKKLRNNSTSNNTAQQKMCNCRNPSQCPLNGECLKKSVVYQATVTRPDTANAETYVGLTENTFKSRFNAHKSSFRNNKQRNATALSQYIWSLDDSNITYNVSWKILTHAKPYCTISGRCNLCISEKYFIICRPGLCSLNSRNELASTCRHRKKHLLCNT